MDPQGSPPVQRQHSRVVRAAIMIVLMVVFAGYLFLWTMIPTKTYKQTWLRKLRLETTSTYFGTNQGANLLLFSLPVLFIAVLGTVYIYLVQNSRDNRTNRSNGTWKKPMVLKGLGIVSRIELLFFLMFIALLLWSIANYFNNLANITPKLAAKIGQELWQARLEKAGLFLGLVGNIVLSFLFFPVTRGSSVLPLFGLTSESSIKYHIWLGHIAMAIFTAHGLSYIIYWAVTHQISMMVEWKNTGVSNIAGEISLLAGLILWITTFPKIRRKMFEVFFYTHHFYILFIIFFILHVGISYATIMLPGFFLFMIDRYLRFLQSRRSVRVISARVLPCQTVELNFSKTKGLCYTPTSIMFINIPSISKMQWHPFTITSSSGLESDKLSVMIKGEGSWSNKLYHLLSSPSLVDHLDVSIEGPYGPSTTDFLRHDSLVMVSGGSGITPFISIIRELIHTSEIMKCKIPQILLISSFKNSDDLTMLDLILPFSGAPTKLSNLRLQIEVYVTREKQPATHEKKIINTIWFKPNPSDAPLAPILGQNNWLWLGAIISSSFIIYLVLIGVLTRYYIYPIDHNTNKIYSSFSRALLHILFLCTGIVIAATGAFLWNKNESRRESIQIQNMEGATPMASPNSWYYNAARELESLPQESLSQSINVHYGGRPDLKKLLLERKESSVGVFVCGPRKMRHEVANICSSGLPANLHFESINFSW